MKEIDLKLIYFSTFLALFGFFISFIMRDVIGSIVQYSLKSLTLALILSLVAKLWYNGMIILNTYDFKFFLFTLIFLLLVNVTILITYSVHFTTLEKGKVDNISLNENINTYTTIFIWALLFNKLYQVVECNNNYNSKICPAPISFALFVIVALASIQLFFVYSSLKVINSQLTDDFLKNFPTQLVSTKK